MAIPNPLIHPCSHLRERPLKFARGVLLIMFGMLGCLLLSACKTERAREPGLEWNNVPMDILSRVDKPTSEQVAAVGFSNEGTNMGPANLGGPRRLLQAISGESGAGGKDTLTLLDFGDDATAFAAFQDIRSNPEDFTEGFAVHEARAYFRRGQWVGSMPIEAWRGVNELVSTLSLPGVPVGTAYAIPAAFTSLLHQGRVEGSERILSREFIGLPIDSRVYAVQINCQGDTAWVYASSGLKREFGMKVNQHLKGSLDSSSGNLTVLTHTPSRSPLKLRFSGAGMAGVEGCYDDSLTNFWIKMQARALKNVK